MTLFQNNCPTATFRSSQVVLRSRLDRTFSAWKSLGPLDDVKLDCLAFLRATKAAYLQHFVSPNQQVVIGTRNVESASLILGYTFCPLAHEGPQRQSCRLAKRG